MLGGWRLGARRRGPQREGKPVEALLVTIAVIGSLAVAGRLHIAAVMRRFRYHDRHDA